MEIVTGGITTGDDFFEGRKQYVDELAKLISTNDILLVGPRRTGKTSLIKEYLLREKENQGICLYLNLEDCKGLYEFYVRVIREVLNLTDKLSLLQTQTGQFIKDSCNKLSQIFKGKIKFPTDGLGTNIEGSIEVAIPTFDANTISELQQELNLILSNLKAPITIVLDEFPEIIFKFPEASRIDETKQLLSGLRAVRQKLTVDQVKTHRVIIAGSINLENTLNSMGLGDTINDLTPLKIPNLTSDEGYTLLTSLALGAEFQFSDPNEAKDFFTKQFGYCTPFYIQLFADNLRNIKRQKRQDHFDLGHIKDAYKVLIQGDRGPNYFLKRLHNPAYYSGSERDPALNILRAIAKKQFETSAHTTDEEIKHLIPDSLIRIRLMIKLGLDDFFQVGGGGNYIFDCQVICNFWNFSLNNGSFLK
jgi:AAA+ ATPase superfamily predicted ATPase